MAEGSEATRIWIERAGGPETMAVQTVPMPSPGAGEALVRVKAIGLNYIDTYHRSGLYPVPMPNGLGLEAAGEVVALGDGVTGLAPGDRVATFGPTLGAYASHYCVPASTLFKLPDTISDEAAAALLLKGCTTEALVERCAKVEPGWTVLVHAAAGAMGLLLTQWLHHKGAIVIGTVSGPAKAEAARDAGADHLINYREEDVAERVRAITGGKGVPVVFDGVGGSTWEVSLKSCAPRGLIVSYGNAGGPVNNVALGTLAAHGSLFVTRPTLFNYYADPAERLTGAEAVFTRIASGVLTPNINQRYALAEAATAHRDLEGGRTTGASILLP